MAEITEQAKIEVAVKAAIRSEHERILAAVNQEGSDGCPYVKCPTMEIKCDDCWRQFLAEGEKKPAEVSE